MKEKMIGGETLICNTIVNGDNNISQVLNAANNSLLRDDSGLSNYDKFVLDASCLHSVELNLLICFSILSSIIAAIIACDISHYAEDMELCLAKSMTNFSEIC